ncbi:MAG: hypothetical protein Q7R71_02290 [bacterium]|nr:hypothetical protein [bacterium]
MADEPAGPGPVEDLLFIVGVIVVLIVLWFATGGPERADLRGIFLHPPAPLDTGGAYGPTIGTTSVPQ